jgi:hypothetical protein
MILIKIIIITIIIIIIIKSKFQQINNNNNNQQKRFVYFFPNTNLDQLAEASKIICDSFCFSSFIQASGFSSVACFAF